MEKKTSPKMSEEQKQLEKRDHQHLIDTMISAGAKVIGKVIANRDVNNVPFYTCMTPDAEYVMVKSPDHVGIDFENGDEFGLILQRISGEKNV